MSSLRISVVTPNLNMGHFLEETIQSVLANLGPQDEYFVIDGASKDNSVEIIRRYESRLTGWVSEKDSSYAEAIGKGFARATGDILCWLNSGDLYLHGALDLARAELRDEGIGLIFGDDFYIDTEGHVLGFSKGWVPNLRHAVLYGGWTPLQEACFWRRDVYQRIGGIDAQLRYAADYDLFLRMSGAGRSAYVPFAFGAFRQHPEQKSIAGMKPYQIERQRRRDEELANVAEARTVQLGKKALFRFLASARARIAPAVWRRHDLHGTHIANLVCASY